MKFLEGAEKEMLPPILLQNLTIGKKETKGLIPGAKFGLEYKEGEESKCRFFIVEADRETVHSRPSIFDRKSHLWNFLQYREYIGRGLHKERLKLIARIVVMKVVTSKECTR